MLFGNVNLKNCVHWVDNNPHRVLTSPLHDEKVTMWCGISSTFILSPYFFEEVTDGNLQTCTVTSAYYEDMLTHVPFLNYNGKILYLKMCGCKMALLHMYVVHSNVS